MATITEEEFARRIAGHDEFTLAHIAILRKHFGLDFQPDDFARYSFEERMVIWTEVVQKCGRDRTRVRSHEHGR